MIPFFCAKLQKWDGLHTIKATGHNVCTCMHILGTDEWMHHPHILHICTSALAHACVQIYNCNVKLTSPNGAHNAPPTCSQCIIHQLSIYLDMHCICMN